jgi:erythromycin esterase
MKRYFLLFLALLSFFQGIPQTEVMIGKSIEQVYPVSPKDTTDFTDLLPLTSFFKDAEIVGMGEATHGTKEFFTMKAKMFKFLVTHCGYKIFSIEATYGGTLLVNDYVTEGKGDVLTAMKGMEFWTCDTEEVRDLIEWMRNYNIGRADGDKLKFYGFDCQSLLGPCSALISYVREFDEQNKDEFLKGLTILPGNNSTFYELGVGKDGKRKTAEVCNDISFIENWFHGNETAYISRSGRANYELALYNTEVLKQTILDREPSKIKLRNNEVRDSCMARNIQWIHRIENAKVFVWAHNEHVSKDSAYYNIPYIRMGAFLDEQFKKKYINIGFVFSRGSFQAPDPKNGYRLKEFTVPVYKKNSLTNAMAMPAMQAYFIDLRGTQNAVFNTFRDTYLVGALFINIRMASEKIRAAKIFDGLIYIDNTNRAVPVVRKAVNL